MYCIKLIIFLQLFYLIDAACVPWTYDWHRWGSCSQSCGGGTRSRTEYSCVFDDSGDTQYQDCNEFCYNGHPYSGSSCICPSWRAGSCCDTCRNIYIAHCKSGKQSCGGSPDNIRCTECEDLYYSGGYGKGCLGLCAWNNHFCWPGECGGNLTTNCKCDRGFKLVSTESETSCQPTKTPAMETCLTTFIGSNGEKKQSTSSNDSSTACEFLQDVYGNFQPISIQYDMLAEFKIPISNITKPSFIKEAYFGLTDVTLVLKKNNVSGRDAEIERERMMTDNSSSIHAKQTFAKNGNISSSDAHFILQNGEWLCVHYECLGGGYLTSINTRGSTHVDLDPTPYQKTNTTKTICYRYDNATPVHCKALNTCTGDPLHVKDRIIRSQEISVYFEDWFDPIPYSGNSSRASSIESYRITVHDTIASKDKVRVDTGHVFTKRVNSTVTSMDIPLTSDKPMLYCIVLEVKDVADNVQQARRFVLYDNSSYIQDDPVNPLHVKSTSVNTNYTWLTHHNEICLQWKDHFFNQFYLDNPVLNAIEPDKEGLISGVYDQIHGLLPVSGTDNVFGIVRFQYFWSLNNGTLSNGANVPNMKNQMYCKEFNMKDGQTFTFKIVATDIANNHFEDTTTVHIDSTAPHIKHIWLQKGDYRSEFFNNSQELSTMDLYFEAFDLHSGILNVRWAFGSIKTGIEMFNGKVSPDLQDGVTCSDNETICYCPIVGYCEVQSYTIPLTKLASMKKSGNYYFKIKATNHALLSTIEQVEISVGTSSSEEDNKQSNTGSIVGGTIGGFVALLILICIIRRLKQKARPTRNNQSSSLQHSNTYAEVHPRSGSEHEYGTHNKTNDSTCGVDNGMYRHEEGNTYEEVHPRSGSDHDNGTLNKSNDATCGIDNVTYHHGEGPSDKFEDVHLGQSRSDSLSGYSTVNMPNGATCEIDNGMKNEDGPSDKSEDVDLGQSRSDSLSGYSTVNMPNGATCEVDNGMKNEEGQSATFEDVDLGQSIGDSLSGYSTLIMPNGATCEVDNGMKNEEGQSATFEDVDLGQSIGDSLSGYSTLIMPNGATCEVDNGMKNEEGQRATFEDVDLGQSIGDSLSGYSTLIMPNGATCEVDNGMKNEEGQSATFEDVDLGQSIGDSLSGYSTLIMPNGATCEVDNGMKNEEGQSATFEDVDLGQSIGDSLSGYSTLIMPNGATCEVDNGMKNEEGATFEVVDLGQSRSDSLSGYSTVNIPNVRPSTSNDYEDAHEETHM